MGGQGYTFEGNYTTKGCYTYSSEAFKSHVYWGNGGTLEVNPNAKYPKYVWPGSVIVFKIEENVDAKTKQSIANAVAEWNKLVPWA